MKPLIVFASMLLALVSPPSAGQVDPQPPRGMVQQSGAPESPAVPALRPRAGYDLSAAEAERFEKRLKAKPDDLETRALLLGYYFAGARQHIGEVRAIEARRRHILWLIGQHPESPLAGSAEATIDLSGHPLADPAGHAEAKALWLEKVRSAGANESRILLNAFHFLRLHDKAQAEDVLLLGQAREPGNTAWTSQLGYLYGLGVMGIDGMNQNGLPTSVSRDEERGPFARKARALLESSSDTVLLSSAGGILMSYGSILYGMRLSGPGHINLAERLLLRAHAMVPKDADVAGMLGEFYALRSGAARTPIERQQFAAKALSYLEIVLPSIKDDSSRSYMLRDVAKMAFEAGRSERARGLAAELLEIAGRHRGETVYGSSVHDGNMLLGRVAAKAGDIGAAKEYLLRAGRDTPDGAFPGFGPNMGLAKDLINRGEREAVIQYLEQCRRFWSGPHVPIDEWIGIVRAGKMPAFGANLNY